MLLNAPSILLDRLEHLEDALGSPVEEALERLGQAAALQGVASNSFAFSHGNLRNRTWNYTAWRSIEELGVSVDDLRRSARVVGVNDLAPGAREAVLESAFEAAAVLEP